MCGICGSVWFGPGPGNLDAVRHACTLLRHRGPDDVGAELIGGAQPPTVVLGAVRLAILDPTPAGHQPMQGAAGGCLVYNGEVYNFRELRGELEGLGHRFRTDTDTEVVLAACAEWGSEALRRLNGMFALAYYDARGKWGFLARDHVGIKPLFYADTPEGLHFASELDALTVLGEWDRTVNPEAIVQHVQFGYIAHPATIYRGAHRLSPGTYLPFRSARAEAPLSYHVESAGLSGGAPPAYGDARRMLHRALGHAVTRQRVSDRPIGAFLSGGLDSSIIVAHLSAVTPGAVKTFSVGYRGARRFDETRYAREVARRFGTEHHEVVLDDRDVLGAIPRVLDHLGEPVGDSSIIPTSLIAAFAARHVTVCLSGDGGDELFGGYWRYTAHEAFHAYRRLPGLIRKLMEGIVRRAGASKSNALTNRLRQLAKLLRTDSSDPLVRHVAWSRILSPRAAVVFRDPETVHHCDAHTVDRARDLLADLAALKGTDGGADGLNRILAFDVAHSLPADMLQKVDLAGMMHSLEVRVPFLDEQIVRTVLPWPGKWKIDRGLRKRILVDTYRGVLPDSVLDRGKMGFEVPFGEYLRGPLKPLFLDVVTPANLEPFAVIDPAGVERVFADHLARRGEHGDVLFALLSLCWWRRRAVTRQRT
jgi:asparagine synthase (glutamine-hydrolysing)